MWVYAVLSVCAGVEPGDAHLRLHRELRLLHKFDWLQWSQVLGRQRDGGGQRTAVQPSLVQGQTLIAQCGQPATMAFSRSANVLISSCY
jgi:hypothetical protein